MPLYEFSCGECYHDFEKLLSTAVDTYECPECKSKTAKRVPSGCSINFKGSGTYKTDNKSWDSIIGADADNRRQKYADRFSKKRDLERKNPNDFITYNENKDSYDVIPANQGCDKVQKENNIIKKEIQNLASSK